MPDGNHQTLTAATDRAEATRLRITESAEALFRRMGYQKTAVADIARDLGMSPANVYRFFPSKSAINEAIAERMLREIAAGAWAVARDDSLSPEERLRRVARHLHERDRTLFVAERRMHDMVQAAMAEHWGVVERFLADTRAAVAHVLADGIARGDFAPGDPVALADAVKHALMAYTHPMIIADCLSHGETGETLEAEMEAVLDLLIRGLRHPPNDQLHSK